MTERHDGTAHADGPDHFRLICSCGWEINPAPNDWDEWIRLLERHRAAELLKQHGSPVSDCVCGHALDRHVGTKTPTHDACAGGTPGFCGCPGYRLPGTP